MMIAERARMSPKARSSTAFFLRYPRKTCLPNPLDQKENIRLK
ncbi:hypothetical protein [Kaistia adipata]|nr:hypothetical protein [Kaistia adipata]